MDTDTRRKLEGLGLYILDKDGRVQPVEFGELVDVPLQGVARQVDAVIYQPVVVEYLDAPPVAAPEASDVE